MPDQLDLCSLSQLTCSHCCSVVHLKTAATCSQPFATSLPGHMCGSRSVCIHFTSCSGRKYMCKLCSVWMKITPLSPGLTQTQSHSPSQISLVSGFLKSQNLFLGIQHIDQITIIVMGIVRTGQLLVNSVISSYFSKGTLSPWPLGKTIL